MLHEVCELPTRTIVQEREGHPGERKWVYQRTGSGFGNLGARGARDLQIRRHVIPHNPRTPAQVDRRAWLRIAVQAWREMNQDERSEWKALGASRALPGYSTFISAFMRAAPPLLAGEAAEIIADTTGLESAAVMLVARLADASVRPLIAAQSAAAAIASAATPVPRSTVAAVAASGYGINFKTAFHIPALADAASPLNWGSKIIPLRQVASAGYSQDTKTNHGTTLASVSRVQIPYATSNAETGAAEYGYAVDPGQMLSVAHARKRIAAGVHRLVAAFTSSVPADGGYIYITLSVYRVSALPSRSRALVASATTQVPVNAGTAIANAPVNVPEIIFAEDETIQYGISVAAQGLLIFGRVVTMHAGTSPQGGGTQSRIEFPGFSSVYA